MSLELPYGIRVLVDEPIDAYRRNLAGQPYTDTAEVIAEIVSTVRYIGMTVLLQPCVEYWFKDGIADDDLVEKTNGSGGSSGVHTIHTNLTSTPNVGGAETTLFTWNVPANTLANNNESIYLKSAGVIAGNANTKRLRIKLGGTVLMDTGDFAAFDASDFVLDCNIVRVDANNQKCWGRLITAIGGYSFAVEVALTKDLTTALALAITGEAADDDDITVVMTQVLFEGISIPAPGITNSSGINELPKTTDGSGNLGSSNLFVSANELRFGDASIPGGLKTIRSEGNNSTGLELEAKGAGWIALIPNPASGDKLYLSAGLMAFGSSVVATNVLLFDITSTGQNKRIVYNFRTNEAQIMGGSNTPGLGTSDFEIIGIDAGNVSGFKGTSIRLKPGMGANAGIGGDGGDLILEPGEHGTPGGNDGNILMPGLPTSSAGLPSGALWNNAGVLSIV